MLKELGTTNGREIALHGGGGNKAQNKKAAAFATILLDHALKRISNQA